MNYLFKFATLKAILDRCIGFLLLFFVLIKSLAGLRSVFCKLTSLRSVLWFLNKN